MTEKQLLELGEAALERLKRVFITCDLSALTAREVLRAWQISRECSSQELDDNGYNPLAAAQFHETFGSIAYLNHLHWAMIAVTVDYVIDEALRNLASPKKKVR